MDQILQEINFKIKSVIKQKIGLNVNEFLEQSGTSRIEGFVKSSLMRFLRQHIL